MGKSEKPKFDELILSKTRLGIISALVGGDKLDFTDKRKWFREVVCGADLACPLETGILKKAKAALKKDK